METNVFIHLALGSLLENDRIFGRFHVNPRRDRVQAKELQANELQANELQDSPSPSARPNQLKGNLGNQHDSHPGWLRIV